MSNEKMKILEMIEKRIVTPEEGLKLLNSLDQLEASGVVNTETLKDITEVIGERVEEANEAAFEEMTEEFEEMTEDLESDIEEIVEELEDTFEEVKEEFKDESMDEKSRSDIEEELKEKVDEIKEKAKELKKKIIIDFDFNGETFKKEFDTDAFKKEMNNLKHSLKGDFKSFAKEARRFGREMSKLGKETANLTSDIVKDTFDTIKVVDPTTMGKDFSENDFVMDPDMETRNYNLAQEFSIESEGKKDIAIEVISTDVTLITEERDDILVNYIKYDPKDEDMYTVVVEEDSKKVKISERKRKDNGGFTFNFSGTGRELLIRIPRKYKESLSVKTVSGDLDMNYLDSDFFRFSSVSGDITADIIYSVNSLIKTTSGDCDIELFRGNMMFTSISGDLEITFEELDGDLTMKTISGDAEIKLPKKSEFEVVAKSTSGDLNCGFPLTIIGAQKRGRLRGQVGSDEYTIGFTSTSGDLDILKY